MTGRHTLAEITTELFQRLEQEALRYAVLRNYERLPHFTAVDDHPFTDVDLVMHLDDIPAWRNLAISLAADCGWDVLTECPHFCVSRAPEHRIEIFRFYRLSPPACLQVDIFHGFLLWGIPFSSESEMLESRVEDRQLNLTRISRSSENVFRMLQLLSLLPHGATREKIERYRAKVQEHYAYAGDRFEHELRREFSRFGEHALEALIRGDLVGFRRWMTRGKAWSFWRFVLRHPLRSLWYFKERTHDHWTRFLTRQCGLVLRVHAPQTRDRDLMREALEQLKRKKILPAWTLREADSSRVTWAEHRVMERGGIVVKWSDGESDLDVRAVAGSDALSDLIVALLIARHSALYVRGAE